MSEKEINEQRYFAARYNIYKTGYKMFLDLEMPGVSKEDLNIQVEGNHLMVEGVKSTGQLAGKYRIHEMKEGVYRNIFTLDDTIDKDKIEGAVKNGIVNISLDIRESEKPRKIEIVSK